MAIAVNNGHVNRALDFYNTPGKYFVIGGTKPWSINQAGNEVPPDAKSTDFRLVDVIGLKHIDNMFMVKPTNEEEGVISYRGQNWKKVSARVEAVLSSTAIAGNPTIVLEDLGVLKIGDKVRVANIYEGTIQSISGKNVTLDVAPPQDIFVGSQVLGGAIVEGAKYVYLDCYLNYDNFPLATYRQIGLCTSIPPVGYTNEGNPDYSDILVSEDYADDRLSAYISLGSLEILDNRMPSTRNKDQRELLSVIIEF